MSNLVFAAGCRIRLYRLLIIAFISTMHLRIVVFVPCDGPKKDSPYILLMFLLFQSSGIAFTINLHNSFPFNTFLDTVVKVKRWLIFVSRCITVAYSISVNLFYCCCCLSWCFTALRHLIRSFRAQSVNLSTLFLGKPMICIRHRYEL